MIRLKAETYPFESCFEQTLTKDSLSVTGKLIIKLYFTKMTIIK